MSSLSHHGIKGQRWGVRRFQNKDGTRTAAGKKRYSVEAVDVNSSRKEIKKLVSDFSKKDKEFFFGEEDWYRDYDSNGDRVAKRFVIKEGKNIVAFIDAERGNHYYSNESLNVVVGTAQSARGKGYASILSKTMVDWYEAEGYKDANMLEWNANKDNIGSRKAAEKAGFKEVLGDEDVGYRYSKNAKKELDELSKARMRVKAIDKEVSDKINSDFKKTKLSKISPNTTITPYGEGETGWNSELGFYKSMVVDHYATKWAKKNHAEDIAKYTKATSDWHSAYSKFDKKRKAKHTSIGGTMYIEGNALILGDSSYLEHHGIKGQRWGVRRFQNKDGTRTAAGKKRDTENLKSSQEAKNVNSKIRSHINKQLSSEDLDTGKSNFDFASDLIKDPDFEKVIMPVVQDIRQTKAKYGNKEPYEFTGDEHNAYMNDISRIDNKTGELAITIGLAEKGESHKKSTPPEGEYERVDMFRYALARYLDEHSPDGYSDEGDWIYHSSMEGTLFIEDGTLYLSHHGIRGQKWGVRRFQNKDGTLTNAGRKRLGYATKGATQAVKKAFKAGVKTGAKAVKAGVKAGGNAVKAAKAHHEKKEAEKLQKKKEKASKTRLGVMANKDLFTNEEIRKLNERFKLEDEMKMATIQKGVEIAKAVGTIAQNVGTVAKTYEDVTGQSLSPIKRKAAEEKARQEKEDRERKLAREDAEEARKAAKEERDIQTHEQTLRKAVALADQAEFTAKKTKAEADSSILDLYKKGREFNGGSDSDETGKSWMEKATSGGGNVFERMKYESDPEYRAAKDAHDKKVEWQQHEKERDARVFGRDKQSSSDALNDMINASERNRKGGSNQEPHVEWNPGGKDGAFTKAEQQSKSRPSDSDEIPFTSKNLRLEKDRYANRDAFRKAKEVKDNAEEKRAKEQDDKAAKSAIDTIMKDYRNQDDVIRNMNPGAYDREVAKNVIKNKAKDTLNKISHPVDAAAKKIADKHREEKWAKERKNLWKEYEDTREKLGPEAAARAYNNAKKQALQNLGYRGEALERKMNETKFYKKKGAKHDAFSIQNGVLFIDESVALAHHGIKGQKWGVRRFQNEDGALTEKGRNHYEKKIEKLDRKQVNSDNRRGALERRHPFAVTASAVLVGSAYAAMLVASAANPATIALGSAVAAAVSALGTHVDYSVAEAWEARGTRRRQKKRKEYEEMLNHDGLIVHDGTLYLEHHGIKGQKWGVRRFQNPDGTLTAAGKKRDARRLQKELNSNDKKWAWESRYASDRKKDYEAWDKAANKARSKGKNDKAEKYEKKRDQAGKEREEHIKNATSLFNKNVDLMKEVSRKGYSGSAKATARNVNTGAEIVGMIALNTLAAAAGSPVLVTRRKYVKGTKFKVKANNEATHYAIQNGTLFIDAGEPYLEHHGVKGMKWGKHLMAGKGEAGAGGGSGEDDEKLKEMAKKAGMSVAEYKQKFASKIGGAASKVGEKISVKDKHLVINGSRSGSRGLAVGETGEKPKSFKEKAYNALGGKYKSQAAEAHKDMVYYKNGADDLSRRANAQGRAANANKRSGNVREYMANKEGARELESEAKGARLSQWDSARKANSAQWKYDHSIAGLYDRATGKYKQVHKRTKIPKTMDQYKYYYSDGPNSKLHNNGSSKAKAAKDQAKAAVWNAADHQIKAKEYNDMSATQAAEREGRLAEASYRKAAALGKQASSETSTSSRPRARKKKHTSGGSGVTVRRPGRKPVSRTKRVTQSSTGVKRRGSTGTGARVR